MIVSFDEFVKQSGGTPDQVQPVNRPQQPKVVDQLGQKPESGLGRVASSYGTKLKEQFMGGLERGAESFNQPEEVNTAIEKRDKKSEGEAYLRGGLRLAGGVAQSLASPITAAAGVAFQGYSELDESQGSPVENKIKEVADNNPEIVGRVSKYIQENPERVKDVEDALNIIGAGKIVPKASNLLKESAERSIKSGIDMLPPPPDLGGVGGAMNNVIDAVTPDSEAIMQRVARISKGRQQAFKDMSGDSVGGYLDKRGIYGDTEEVIGKLFERFKASKDTADNALAEIQGTYRSQPVRTALNELDGKVERTSSPGAPDKDLPRVKELLAKERKEGLTMSEINEVKRIYERRVKLDYVKTKAPEEVTRATNVDNAVREWQFKEADKAGLKNLAEINKETQSAKYLLDAIGKENAGTAGNNAVTLTDWIVLSGGDPTAISAFLVKKGFSSKDIQSWFAKNFSKNTEKIGIPEAQFKDRLQLNAGEEGAPMVSNEIPINLGKSQTKADQNLDTMNATQAKPQEQEILQKPSVNTTPKKESGKGISFKNPRGMIDPSQIIRDIKGKFAGIADKFSENEYKKMIDFIDYAHGAKKVSFDESVKLEEAAQKFLQDQGKKIPKTRAKLRDAVQEIIDEANFPTNE